MPKSESEVTSTDSSYMVPETYLKLGSSTGPPPILPRKHGFVFFPEQASRSNALEPSPAPEAEPEAAAAAATTAAAASVPASGRTSPATITRPTIPAEGEELSQPVEDQGDDEKDEDQVTSLPRRDSWGNITPLTELTARAPGESRAEMHQASDLENRLKHESGTADSSIWQSPRKKRAVRIMNTLYTISYLIFFSILGTLARLGLQALTTYPGAPVTTPVVWANVGGSLILGFLAEDRMLFMEELGDKHRQREQKLEALKQRRRQQRRQDRELVQRSQRYSQTVPMARPFTNPTTARLYPKTRVYDTTPPSRGQQSDPSTSSSNVSVLDPIQERKRHNAVKKLIPLYIGLATGFCGSFTSFSSFMRDAFLALANSNATYPTALNGFSSQPDPRSGGFSFLALLAVLIYEPALSLAGYVAGGHLALALDRKLPAIPYRFTSSVLNRLVLVLGPGCWIAAAILVAMPPDRPGGPAAGPDATWATEAWRSNALFACALAPFGCILRFYTSLLLNSRAPSFPLGTFAVNVGGSAFEAMLYALQRAALPTGIGGGIVGCQAMQGGMDGFCGCLTTVSTWVAELHGLRRRHAWLYGLSSIVAGLAVTVVIVGPVRWGVGFAEPACVL